MVTSSHPGPDWELARLAARQHGVVSITQLNALGLSTGAARQRAKAGKLHRVHRGVYSISPLITMKGRWMAAVLASGPEAMLSHLSALALYDIRPTPRGPIDVTVPARGRSGYPGIRIHCVRALHPNDRSAASGIPVTSVPRALLDYAEHTSLTRLRTAVEAADRQDLLDGRALNELLTRATGRHGTPRLKQALELLLPESPWTQSELEIRFHEIVRAAGLPEPSANVIVHGELVDFYWAKLRLVVEVDSYKFHKDRKRFEDDRRKDAKLQLAGERVLRYTDRRINTEPSQIVAELRRIAR
jgi:hypothetical protein